MDYAYIGNVPAHEANHTYCTHCGEVVEGRVGFTVVDYQIANGTCGYCGEPIAGVWGLKV